MRLRIYSGTAGMVPVFEAEIRKLDDYRIAPKSLRRNQRGQSLWDRMARSWRTSRARMFETAGASAGTPWLSYDATDEAEWYKWFKAIVYGNDATITVFDVLRWRGSDRLMLSFVDPTSRWYVQQETATSLGVGSSLPYAANHDMGVGRAPAKLGGHAIPKRPLTGVGADLRHAWRDDLIDYATDWGVSLGEKLDRAGARLLPLA